MASLGIQVHGGTGFIEETGAAQHLRDARIAPIYEGTNGIQAIDLVSRKLMRDSGAAAHAFLEELQATVRQLTAEGVAGEALGRRLAAAADDLSRATRWLLDTLPRNVDLALAGASPYLTLFGTVAGAWILARQAQAAAQKSAAGGDMDRGYLSGKTAVAQFYADNLLSAAPGLAAQVIEGGDSTLALAPNLL